MDTLHIDVWRPLAGLVIFLLAMRHIETGIKALAGNQIKAIIARNTDRPLRGVISGALATGLLQSSSLVGLLTLAFVGAGIMSLPQALLIIFGANLGTTATGWLVALLGFKLDLDAISLPLITLGGFCFAVLRSPRFKSSGELMFGIGLLLLGLQFMKSGISDPSALAELEVFSEFSIWQYALFGIAASAFMQSSSAVMVLTLSGLHAGIIDLHAAAALIVGADFGTTSTIIFGAIDGGANKKRVAAAHVLFNVVTDTLAFVLLVPLIFVASKLNDPLLSLVAFHSMFNVIGVMIWTPFVSPFAAFLERRFSDDEVSINIHLTAETKHIPEVAWSALKKELLHLAHRVIELNANLFVTPSIPTMEAYLEKYGQAKQLEAEIIHYALDSNLENDPGLAPAHDVHRCLSAARNLLLSAKLCKDNMEEMRSLEDHEPALFQEIITSQQHLYSALRQLSVHEGGGFDRSQVHTLYETSQRAHDQLHDRIYISIKKSQLLRSKVSSVLNLNRAVFNSNLALLTGLGLMLPAQKKHHGKYMPSVEGRTTS